MKRKVMHRLRAMKALTLRNLPDQVCDAVQKKAEADHLSFSRALVCLLEERLGQTRPRQQLHHDLDHLFGQWTDEKARDFDQIIRKNREADKAYFLQDRFNDPPS